MLKGVFGYERLDAAKLAAERRLDRERAGPRGVRQGAQARRRGSRADSKKPVSRPRRSTRGEGASRTPLPRSRRVARPDARPASSRPPRPTRTRGRLETIAAIAAGGASRSTRPLDGGGARLERPSSDAKAAGGAPRRPEPAPKPSSPSVHERLGDEGSCARSSSSSSGTTRSCRSTSGPRERAPARTPGARRRRDDLEHSADRGGDGGRGRCRGRTTRSPRRAPSTTARRAPPSQRPGTPRWRTHLRGRARGRASRARSAHSRWRPSRRRRAQHRRRSPAAERALAKREAARGSTRAGHGAARGRGGRRRDIGRARRRPGGARSRARPRRRPPSSATAEADLAAAKDQLAERLGEGEPGALVEAREAELTAAEEAAASSGGAPSRSRDEALDRARERRRGAAPSDVERSRTGSPRSGGRSGSPRSSTAEPDDVRGGVRRSRRDDHDSTARRRRHRQRCRRPRARRAAEALRSVLATLGLGAEADFVGVRAAGRAPRRRPPERSASSRPQIARASDLERHVLAAEARTIALATRLADDLKPSRFLAFLLEEERAELAELGSGLFESLTDGNYRFAADDSFDILDLNAADRTRKADSLSGGETFLASLALALALAEMVARGGGRLDAFFLDEGFGSLDPEHLDRAMDGHRPARRRGRPPPRRAREPRRRDARGDRGPDRARQARPHRRHGGRGRRRAPAAEAGACRRALRPRRVGDPLGVRRRRHTPPSRD